MSRVNVVENMQEAFSKLDMTQGDRQALYEQSLETTKQLQEAFYSFFKVADEYEAFLKDSKEKIEQYQEDIVQVEEDLQNVTTLDESAELNRKRRQLLTDIEDLQTFVAGTKRNKMDELVGLFNEADELSKPNRANESALIKELMRTISLSTVKDVEKAVDSLHVGGLYSSAKFSFKRIDPENTDNYVYMHDGKRVSFNYYQSYPRYLFEALEQARSEFYKSYKEWL